MGLQAIMKPERVLIPPHELKYAFYGILLIGCPSIRRAGHGLWDEGINDIGIFPVYRDIEAAPGLMTELVKRMNSYYFYTQLENNPIERADLDRHVTVGEPTVRNTQTMRF
jgi:hypothetical protein